MENTTVYDKPQVVTIDGNNSARGVEAQPTGVVWKETVALVYAYAIALVVWTQIDITP